LDLRIFLLPIQSRETKMRSEMKREKFL